MAKTAAADLADRMWPCQKGGVGSLESMRKGGAAGWPCDTGSQEEVTGISTGMSWNKAEWAMKLIRNGAAMVTDHHPHGAGQVGRELAS